ncbi:MAG: hypothetical protein P8O10_05100, partial [Pseudorhodobacter sp.]|nr:hypothetical protein [Pseudorhodobacter sp.]
RGVAQRRTVSGELEGIQQHGMGFAFGRLNLTPTLIDQGRNIIELLRDIALFIERQQWDVCPPKRDRERDSIQSSHRL